MGRRRAHKKSGMSHLRGVKNLRKKDEEKFRTTLMTGEEVDRMFSTFHQIHIEPLWDVLNYMAEPWYKRLWWNLKRWANAPIAYIKNRGKTDGESTDHADADARGVEPGAAT